MIEENQIRVRLLALSDLEEFEDWLAQESWNMHRDSDQRAQSLVGKIELALAEYSNGHVSESELRQQLRNLARTYEVSFNPPTAAETITYSSSSMVQKPLVAMQASAVSVS
jgi:hypothetical protein